MTKPEKKTCECEFCVRTRAFELHLQLIEDPNIRDWFKSFFEYTMEIEEDLACYKVYLRNLKTLYPKIWKEVHTIKHLERNDAQFPEKQL